MKIMVLADEESKYLWDYFDKKKLEGIDLIISCGDLAPQYLSFLATFTHAPVYYVHGNHDEIKEILEELNIDKVDGILLDLGVSSYQLDERNRGFSYLGSNELDMRMDQTQSLTAKDVVNNYDEEKLANIVFEYGEEKFYRNIERRSSPSFDCYGLY